MVSSYFWTSLKFILIKENEYEQYIRSGDNLHGTQGETWARTSPWIFCLTWPRVCITLWEVQVQCTTFNWIWRCETKPYYCNDEEKPWSLEIPCKNNNKPPDYLLISGSVFSSSVFSWTLPWLQNGAEFLLKVLLFQLLLTPCSAEMCVSSLWKIRWVVS